MPEVGCGTAGCSLGCGTADSGPDWRTGGPGSGYGIGKLGLD